jgi:hypothetical protein
MKQIVFYSWQSDLPNASNRGFIQRALESAAQAIKADDAVEIEPVVDRDTQGVPGSPEIASTIFSKITAADVFVADVSIAEGPAPSEANLWHSHSWLCFFLICHPACPERSAVFASRVLHRDGGTAATSIPTRPTGTSTRPGASLRVVGIGERRRIARSNSGGCARRRLISGLLAGPSQLLWELVE